MHRHAAAARHEAQDLVARHRVATARQAHEHVVDALHDDAVRAVRFAALRRDDACDHGGHDTGARLGLPEHTGPRLLVPVVDKQLQQAVAHMLRAFLPRADVDKHVIRAFVTHVLGDRLDCTHRVGARDADAVLLHLARQAIAAYLQVVGAARFTEEPANLVARRGRLHDIQPVARRRGALLREDFHAIAQLELVGQRHDGAVHLRAHTVVAHLGVDGVGEIDRRGARPQAHDLAFRGEHEHLGRR